MNRITYFKDRNYLVASIQGYVSQTVRKGLFNRGFRYDGQTRVHRAPYSEEAESYLKFLEKVWRERDEEKAAARASRPQRQPYLDLFNAGHSIEDIASINAVHVQTVYDNLIKSVEERRLDPDRLIDEGRLELVEEYLCEKDDWSHLKPLKEEAPFRIEYWEIKLAIMLMKAGR